MSIILKGILALFWLLLVPAAIGNLFMSKIKHICPEACLPFGYLVLFSLMEIFTLPLTFLKAPLHILTALYGGVAVLLAAAGVVSVVGNKEKRQNMISVQKRESKITFYFALALLLIICQIVMCTLLAHMDADDSFFVASATTDVYTDTIFEVNPDTGRYYMVLPERYILSPFPVFLAVVSQLSAGLHPAIMAHMVFPAVFLIVVYMVQSLLSRCWFPNDRKARDIYLLLVAVISSFSAYSVYNAGNFQMVRLWQGKAILAAILIPMLVYLCLTIVMKEKADYSWGLMLMANLSCCLVSSMGIILAPLLIGSFAVVKLIYKKDFMCIWKCALCCIPTLVLGLIFLYVL